MLKLARYLKPYLLAVVAVAILVFLQSISQLYLPNLMSEIVDVGIVSGDSSFILRVGGRMLLVAALGAACTIAPAICRPVLRRLLAATCACVCLRRFPPSP